MLQYLFCFMRFRVSMIVMSICSFSYFMSSSQRRIAEEILMQYRNTRYCIINIISLYRYGVMESTLYCKDYAVSLTFSTISFAWTRQDFLKGSVHLSLKLNRISKSRVAQQHNPVKDDNRFIRHALLVGLVTLIAYVILHLLCSLYNSLVYITHPSRSWNTSYDITSACIIMNLHVDDSPTGSLTLSHLDTSWTHTRTHTHTQQISYHVQLHVLNWIELDTDMCVDIVFNHKTRFLLLGLSTLCAVAAWGVEVLGLRIGRDKNRDKDKDKDKYMDKNDDTDKNKDISYQTWTNTRTVWPATCPVVSWAIKCRQCRLRLVTVTTCGSIMSLGGSSGRSVGSRLCPCCHMSTGGVGVYLLCMILLDTLGDQWSRLGAREGSLGQEGEEDKGSGGVRTICMAVECLFIVLKTHRLIRSSRWMRRYLRQYRKGKLAEQRGRGGDMGEEGPQPGNVETAGTILRSELSTGGVSVYPRKTYVSPEGYNDSCGVNDTRVPLVAVHIEGAHAEALHCDATGRGGALGWHVHSGVGCVGVEFSAASVHVWVCC